MKRETIKLVKLAHFAMPTRGLCYFFSELDPVAYVQFFNLFCPYGEGFLFTPDERETALGFMEAMIEAGDL